MKIIWPNTQETTTTTITITGCYYNDKWNLHNDLIKAPKNNDNNKSNSNSNKARRSCEKLRRRFRDRERERQTPVARYCTYTYSNHAICMA